MNNEKIIAWAVMKDGECLSVRRFEPVASGEAEGVEFVPLVRFAEQPAQQQDHDLLMREPSVIRDRLIQAGWTPPAQQPAQIDWEAVAADQAMTIGLLKSELQEFAERQADAVEVALTESGWVWDGDQWQRPAQQEPVAWKWKNKETGNSGVYLENPDQFFNLSVASIYEWTPLYKSQPAQRKPLTDEQIIASNYPDGEENGPTIAAPDFELICFARQIEAAHGIKEDA